MAYSFKAVFTVAAIFSGLVTAQCPNLVAQYQVATSRSMSTNQTWFIVPVPRDDVQKAVDETTSPIDLPGLLTGKLSLLPVPLEYNITEGYHPVLVSSGFMADIRQDKLQLDKPLIGSSLIVPWVGRSGSKIPLNRPIITYLAGTGKGGEALLYGKVPSLVATLLGGILTKAGYFIPNNAAYQQDVTLSDFRAIYSRSTKWAVVPNSVSGPGVYSEAFDLHFSSEENPRYSTELFKRAINQPYLLNFPLGGKCQRNTYFFNNATADIQFRSGNVTLGPAASANGFRAALLKSTPNGDFIGVHGLSACAQVVGYDTLSGEDCEEAARQVDSMAL
ncbi:hypothetical protein HBI56_207870 [Parastagonospora nodorum]|uniref:Uncharacterized protein n=1 Tax=Phaeosphaeria nodorum (strain SN15 / ATCC MYA-4574 / FGSC 10173) TaxID=321614 RepID=A0A7U2I920_PHANO|nr:hypothetical protein HBH56_217180 [Parastagonospora nodorum]QRD05493.1 hypothetical protein JI435_154260 [Parastagonospora nodorum SN15]KAH3922792.1 hypothetical protein HBH54_219040 [Parastagonospora nodorum]KAH3941155.1 hypothetical protein HBH53_206550 [Parastagonospora nodorum]KAH3961441.1 hypothetical protein HBH52_229890 [Parastagonospora nodorum]